MEAYKQKLIDLAQTTTDWGSKSGIAYEDIPEFNLEGQRNTMRRAEVFGIPDDDWHGDTVVDFGCSTGSFSRLAQSEGAARVVGVDLPETVKTAFEISNFLRYWNIDFYSYTFSKDKESDYDNFTHLVKAKEFDIVLFLSVHAQIGYPTTWMKKLCKDRIYLEGHSGHNEGTFRPLLEKDFTEVRYMGQMKNNARPALVAYK
jgi:SAM-dependent methyltransferase